MDNMVSKPRALDRLRRPVTEPAFFPEVDELRHSLEQELDLSSPVSSERTKRVGHRMHLRRTRRQARQRSAAPSPLAPRAIQPLSLMATPAPQPARATPTRTSAWHVRRSLWLALTLAIVLAGLTLAYGLVTQSNGYTAAAPQPQPQPTSAVDQSRADAEWDTAVKQWQCTLAQYEGQQSTSNNSNVSKESALCATPVK